jgi:hypothetical protein
LAANVLGLVVLLINMFCAVRAPLGTGRIALPIVLSLLTATLLGVALALGLGHDQLGWHVFVGSVLVLILPAAIVIASLMVARSCGYRLISKQE